MKNNRQRHIALSLLLATLSSCVKVIDLNLNRAEKKLVIEAQVTDVAGQASVLISQTKDYDEDNSFQGISGATVTITEEGGSTATLSESAAGVYTHSVLTGTAGKNYALSVMVNGEIYTAACRMPQKVNLDTVYAVDEYLFGENRKVVNADFQDPAGRGNNYRFIQYINGQRIKQIIVQYDEYTDGRYVNSRLFYLPDEDSDESDKIKSGDEIKVEMHCIAPVVYKYWYSLSRSATGISGQATPANPVSNMKGGALGYFSTHTIQSKTFIVP